MQSSRSIMIEADVPNTALELQAGLFAEAELVVNPAAQAISVPSSAISRFAGDAVSAAADARWLPQLGDPWAVHRLVWTLPIRPWVVLQARDPTTEPGVDFAIDVAPWVAVKTAALRAHRTQHLNLERVFFSKSNMARLIGTELFRQAWGPALSVRPAADLFVDVAV